ncbi:MAG: hypothetical protein ACYC6Y_26915 [Thermoguttaceae bacterium]
MTYLLTQGGRAAGQYELPGGCQWPAPGKSLAWDIAGPGSESRVTGGGRAGRRGRLPERASARFEWPAPGKSLGSV